MHLNLTPTVVYRYVVQSEPGGYYVWDNDSQTSTVANVTYYEALAVARDLNFA